VKFAGYVLSGYAITFATIGAYWLRVVRRTQRAESTLPEELRDS
jgi:hypothetical protein